MSTTNRRMLADCKHHKMFSYLSGSICVRSITGKISKAGTLTPPKEYKVCWSEEMLGVFRLDKKMDNRG